MGRRARKLNHPIVEQKYTNKAEETEREASVIRNLLLSKKEITEQPDLTAAG